MRAAIFVPVLLVAASAAGADLKVRISWGHQAASASPPAAAAPAASATAASATAASAPYFVRLTATEGLEVRSAAGAGLEAGEGEREGAWQTRAGAGDVDALEFTLSYDAGRARRAPNLHIIWSDLIAASDADTARRLGRDATVHTASPKLTVSTNAEGTSGFSVTLDQLLNEKALWVPALGMYVTAGDRPVPFDEHLRSLEPRKGARILDRVPREPEASYEEYTARWEDMGHPGYTNPEQRGPGHIVGLTWDSAIPKFGIDRGGGVWNDYGNPDKFRFWFAFGDLSHGSATHWKSQSLAGGMPLIATVFERDGLRYELEQFAYPLEGPPAERKGDIPMVLLERVRISELEGRARRVPVSMTHRRQFAPHFNSELQAVREGKSIVFRDAGFGRTVLSIESGGEFAWNGTADYQREQKRFDVTLFKSLPARGAAEFVVKLPSPPVTPEQAAALAGIDYAAAREQTLKFWSGWLERGAQFTVPEKKVNDLFRANLWHALRLPRRHGGSGDNVAIDLPYSNFAYSQTGTPWPVNQAVYVDYMLYDLRGYHRVSAEELLAQFRNNQERDGHVSGYANWLVYTPSMLYAAAQNYLLSGDRENFDRLLPYSLKALDWCLDQVARSARRSGPARGLVNGPLNDGTGEGLWAFNQAYMYAGLDLFGRALEAIAHPRGAEARKAAREIRQAIGLAFASASVQSPLVQLRDGTWIPYVPCEARTPRRLMDVWYPTDVDTGAVHLIRLKAIDPHGSLADWLLNDHEDNLYYKGWGIANEPVYNQQATAYLLRDDPAAVIRAFYSYMASAFSHSALEPVEHRWTHGQYFGPPSTDGAWFELYRNMLVHERDDGTLALGMAAPRRWLADGKKIEVQGAPTYYGRVSMTMESRAASGRISAAVTMPDRSRPRELLVRLRHPEGKAIRGVTVNGLSWTDYDARKEWVRIAGPKESRYSIECSY